MSSIKIQLSQELQELLNNQFSGDIVLKFRRRIQQSNLTIQENPKSHFCIYFAAYDSKIKKIFIGHHKKSGFWLFNGGHIDKGETMRETLKREIDEEWGLDSNKFEIKNSALLTITKINNPAKQTCELHYDIWNFISVNKDNFKPNYKRLYVEFYKVDWKSLKEAKKLVTEVNTLIAIDFIEKELF